MPARLAEQGGGGMESASRGVPADAHVPAGADQGAAAADPDIEWAICCSGGGIRSASYCLGALQSLQSRGLLEKAGLILSVSGGSYIAASRALVARGLERRKTDRGAAPDGPGIRPAYAPGTPEEQNLRDNTHYIAPHGGTVLVGVLSLLVGVTVTFLLAFAPVFAAAHAWGWLLRSQKVLCPGSAQRCAPPGPFVASVTGLTWWLVPVAAGALTLVLFGWWWVTLKPRQGRHRDRGDTGARVVGWSAVLTIVLAVAMLLVPLLLSWVAKLPVGPFKSLLYDLGFGAGQKWTPAALAGVFAAVIAVGQSARAKLAQLHLPGVQSATQSPQGQAKGQSQGQKAAQSGVFAMIGGGIRAYLLPWLASAVIVLAAVVAGLRWVKDGTAAGYSADQLWPVLIALGVMLAARVFADVNRISMHDFYRWRLASAYAVVRKPSGDQPPGVDPDPGALLSSLTPQSPRLVVCATANINADREVPVGRGGLSFTFDPEHVTLRGEDPSRSVRAATADYETLVGKRRFTLFDLSAISGAAVSPLMGSMTRPAYRILLTMTNVRLGVWLPHPKVVDAARRELKKQEAEGRKDRWLGMLLRLAWYALPLHPFWHAETTEEPGGGEARLWAYVLRLRQEGKWFGAFMYHALQPTLGMLWAEAVGHTSYRSTWVCVSDGGHYDNLGLVEALQRGAKNILVLDASGDKANTWFTLGGAFALARVDARVDITLDPTGMCPGSPPRPGAVVRPWADGTFRRMPEFQGGPAGPPLPATGTIWVCKLGWWRDAPWDVRAYAGQHPEFPGLTTLQQLYDGAEFDAYRELGLCSAEAAQDNGLGNPAAPGAGNAASQPGHPAHGPAAASHPGHPAHEPAAG